MKKDSRSIVSCDPGQHTGLVLFLGGVFVECELVLQGSTRGAERLHEVIVRFVLAGAGTLVVENQYPRPGRSYASIFGLAAYRGACEHEARMAGMKIVRVKPDEWKHPVLRRCGCAWRAAPEVKEAALREYVVRLLPVGWPAPPSQDVVDAYAMGHHYLHKGLYL